MLKGKAFKFGDDISTDLIVPGRLVHLRSNLPELAKHVLEDADPTFAARVKPGDFVVGGNNFGLGSSREHAPIAMGSSNCEIVLAESFARIFFRNCVATGELYPCECADRLCDILKTGEIVTVDLDAATVTAKATGKVYQFKPLGDVRPVVDAGGLFNFARNSGMIAK